MVHEWKGILFGQTVMFRMTSVCGHVLTIDFHPKFNNWDRVDPVSIVLRYPALLEISISRIISRFFVRTVGIIFLSY